MDVLFKYLKQASTWQGITGLITAVGISLNPSQIAAIAAAGIAVVGVIDVFWDTDA